MEAPVVFSLIFTVVCAISLFLGIYTLYLNSHSVMNRVFFALTIALDIWAFGFSIAISAPDLGTCLFWRRFSAIGWGALFSILLHFFLIYTSNDHLLKKIRVYIILYLPSAITFVGFTYFQGINPDQYNLVKESFGWTNIAANNAWDWFYNIYYFSFTAASFYLLWSSKKKQQDQNTRKQKNIILFSFFLTILGGSLTDIICNSVISIAIPQMAPLLMLFPIVMVYYSIKKLGLMKPKHVDFETVLFNEQIRRKMINYFSCACLLGSLLNIVTQYLFYENTNFVTILLFSLFILFIGFAFQVIQRCKVRTFYMALLFLLLYRSSY
ncbi:MAG: histidine kinase N-terminal 7TM domain-containing protein [Pseudoflavonifractor sp.]|nr:histidine kinase N-terminal 7TM domain-containing protein [Pseudoflavonifractor sp.]